MNPAVLRLLADIEEHVESALRLMASDPEGAKRQLKEALEAIHHAKGHAGRR